jgi:hypothetical protein
MASFIEEWTDWCDPDEADAMIDQALADLIDNQNC